MEGHLVVVLQGVVLLVGQLQRSLGDAEHLQRTGESGALVFR